MNNYKYGTWRGLPARENQTTGMREFYRDDMWQGLGLGYREEFKLHPEEVSPDQWENLHRS